MRKTIIKDYVKSLGEKAYYSGKTKTMYVTDKFKDLDIPMQSTEGAILQKFGFGLPFKLATNENN